MSLKNVKISNNDLAYPQAIFVPQGTKWDILNNSMRKTASLDKSNPIDLGGFDLQAAIGDNPDHLFVKVFAIKKDEVNDNGDAFSEVELKKAAHTFIGVPVFVNHQNDDIEKARGSVVHAWYDDAAGGIYIISKVDKQAYPKLARGIEEKYVIGTSMGASVEYSLCSVCHNKAHTQDEFCPHVKERKNKKFSGKMKCRYHESDCKPSDDCPVCGCKKGASIENMFKDAKIFEHNYGIRFIEDSFVVNPACHDCLVCDVLNLDKLQQKVASMTSVIKTATDSMEDKINSGCLEKTAGQKEIMDLNDAMNRLERVARSMMAQKQKIQLEYVSDIVESLADIQAITDELIQMGYNQLPSPTEEEIAFGTQTPASPAGNQAQQTQPQNMPQPQMGGMTGSMPMQQTGSPQVGNLGNQVGTVTKPSFSASASISGEEFIKTSRNLQDKLKKIEAQMSRLNDTASLGSTLLSNNNITCQVSQDNYRVIVSSREDGEIHVAEYKDDLLLRVSNADVFNNDTRHLLRNEPQKVAEQILKQLIKESGSNMAMNKTAAGVDKNQIEMTTEAQLDKNRTPIGGRQENAPEGITESKEQLGGSEKINDTKSESPQVRRGSYETITEDQLATIKDGYMVRWNDYPEVITEGQWDETSRAVRAALPDDWTESVTQQQLISLRDNHSWVDPHFITERQLGEQKDVLPNDATARFAKKMSTKDILKAAMSVVSDAISKYNLTPQQVSQSVARMTVNPQSQIKAARLSLLNSIPRMIEARQAECKRRNYFAKVASEVATFKPIDGLLAALGDNIGYIKANDLLEAVRFASSDEKVMKKAEQEALTKIASRSDDSETIVDINAAYRQAFAELDKSDDGIYKVCGSISDDLKIATNDRNKLIAAVDTFARSQVTAETILTDIDVDVEAGTFEAIVKEAYALTEEEKKAHAKIAGCPPWLEEKIKGKKNEDEDKEKKDDNKEDKKEASTKSAARKAAREELLKQAQMMGGQMGGGMGAGGPGDMSGGGGQGATMPAPPGGETPPVESFTEEPMGEDVGDDSAPKPPGAVCPACGKEDVDAAGGKHHCNNCGLDFITKVHIEYLTQDENKEGDELGADKGLEDELGGEGFPMSGAEQEPASLPVAAMTRLNPNVLKKLAASGIKIGEVSPLTGSRNTMKLAGNKFFCLDTGCEYEVALRSGKGNDKNMYAEWRWIDRHAETECKTCHRQRKAFAKSLKSFGLTEAQFDAAQAMDKAKIILAMQEKGLLKNIKTASKNGSILDDFKTAFSISADKFPIESCREKLARRYGENAIALSGPCEGSKLADCVCNNLKSAGFYSDGLAIKLASIWSDEDGTVECWEDYIRGGLNAKQAATVCEQIRRKYSQAEHFVADAMNEPAGMNNVDTSMTAPTGGMGGTDDGVDESMGDAGLEGLADPTIDPFAADETPSMDASIDGDTAPEAGVEVPTEMPGDLGMSDADPMSKDLPLEVLDALKELNEQVIKMVDPSAVPSAGASPVDPTGADPMAGEAPAAVEVEMTTDDPSQVGEMAEQAVDTAVDAVEDVAGEPPALPGDSVPGEESVSDGDSIPGSEPSSDLSEDTNEEKSSVENGDESPNEENEEINKDEEGLEKEGTENKEGCSMAESNNMVKEAEALRTGRIVANHKVNLDVSSILNVLNKKADQSKLVQKNVQDDADIGKISGDSTIGKEDKFTADKPDVPSKGSGATMGKEPKDLHPGSEGPSVFTGSAEMGHEKDQGYTSEKTNENTGGDKGAGNSKAAKSTKSIVSGLADRITAAQNKTASDKKLDKSKPVSEDGDIGTISNNKDLSTTNESDKAKPFAEGDKKGVNNVPEKGEGALMGHEKDTIKQVPKPENSAPQIPAGGGKNPKYDTKWDAEKQTENKGTVIANNNEKSKARKEAATKLAGRMIERGVIKSDQLMAKIAELEQYDVPQIADLEKAMFASAQAKAKKGLDTVSNGSEKAVVIAETSSFNKGNSGDDLKNKIQSLFKLQKQNDAADDNPDSQLRLSR